MNRPLTFTVFLLAWIVAGIFYVAHDFDEARQIHFENKAIEYQVLIERKCGYAFPLKSEVYDECVARQSILTVVRRFHDTPNPFSRFGGG